MKVAVAPRQRPRVLVVEDERDVTELLRYDIMVPHLNGWGVCRRLEDDAETHHIPVVLVTGRVEEGDKVLGFRGPRDHRRPRDRSLPIRGAYERSAGFADAEGVRAARHPGRRPGSRLRPRGSARDKFRTASLPVPAIETVRGVGYRFKEPRQPSGGHE